MIPANKLIGTLMSGDPKQSDEVIAKIPHIHRFILQAITQINLDDAGIEQSLKR